MPTGRKVRLGVTVLPVLRARLSQRYSEQGRGMGPGRGSGCDRGPDSESEVRCGRVPVPRSGRGIFRSAWTTTNIFKELGSELRERGEGRERGKGSERQRFASWIS